PQLHPAGHRRAEARRVAKRNQWLRHRRADRPRGMTMRQLVLLFATIVLLVPVTALAGPPDTMVQQGRIVQDGVPVTGQATLVFSFRDGGESELYNEVHTVDLVDGFYSVELGKDGGLPDILLRQDVARVVVSVNGTELQPGHSLSSVPYAHVAKNVEGGDVVTTSISIGTDDTNAKVVVDSTGEWSGELAEGTVDADDLAFTVLRSKSQIYQEIGNGTVSVSTTNVVEV